MRSRVETGSAVRRGGPSTANGDQYPNFSRTIPQYLNTPHQPVLLTVHTALQTPSTFGNFPPSLTDSGSLHGRRRDVHLRRAILCCSQSASFSRFRPNDGSSWRLHNLPRNNWKTSSRLRPANLGNGARVDVPTRRLSQRLTDAKWMSQRNERKTRRAFEFHRV